MVKTRRHYFLPRKIVAIISMTSKMMMLICGIVFLVMINSITCIPAVDEDANENFYTYFGGEGQRGEAIRDDMKKSMFSTPTETKQEVCNPGTENGFETCAIRYRADKFIVMSTLKCKISEQQYVYKVFFESLSYTLHHDPGKQYKNMKVLVVTSSTREFTTKLHDTNEIKIENENWFNSQ